MVPLTSLLHKKYHQRKCDMLSKERALALVRGNVFNTIGCTEPVAIAYAATAAYQHLGGTIKSLDIEISVNMFKNAMAVGIPGSDQKGIKFATALGLVAGNWEKGLSLFEGVTSEHLAEAGRLSSNGLISVGLTDQPDKVFISTLVRTDRGTAKAEIRGSHANLLYVDVNGERVYESEGSRGNAGAGTSENRESEELKGLQMEELAAAVDAIPEEELDFLSEAVDVNVAAAEYGLENSPGMGLGTGTARLMKAGIVGDSLATRVEQYVAAAADSRMSGQMVPIKGCGGSGNHGIAFFLGTGLAWRHAQDRAVKSLAKTLAMGLLLVKYIKEYTGLLTPTCGVTVSAAPASAASLVYAMGGSPEEMTAAVKLVLGNIAGILCDGAKHGCSLKAATSARFGVQAAFLVLEGVRIPDSDGIIGADLPTTMENLRRIQENGLTGADQTMLDVLLEKSAQM